MLVYIGNVSLSRYATAPFRQGSLSPLNFHFVTMVYAARRGRRALRLVRLLTKFLICGIMGTTDPTQGAMKCILHYTGSEEHILR